MDSKALSHNIANFDKDAWNSVAKEACQPGISAKFEQNPLLLQFLLATYPLKLAESSYDRLWGTGIPLNDDKAFRPNPMAQPRDPRRTPNRNMRQK